MANSQESSQAGNIKLGILSPAKSSTITEADLSHFQALTLSTNVGLMSMPIEIQLAIISHLVSPADKFLRSTNRHFSTLIPPWTHRSLLVAETTDLARAQDAYACALCLRLRRAGSFADVFRKTVYSRDYKNGKQEKRFCIDCGVKGRHSSMKYNWGDSWTRFGLPYVKCCVCRTKKRGAKERKDCPMCPACWEKKRRKK